MSLTNEAREQAAVAVERNEVFENEKFILYTYEVDPAYKAIVEAMAGAIWNHDKSGNLYGKFPTGDPEQDDPYLCRADDALAVALPLLRSKIAGELRNGSDVS